MSDTPVVLEAARGDTLNVSCRVTSLPEPVRYRWGFNSSGRLRSQSGDIKHFRRISYDCSVVSALFSGVIAFENIGDDLKGSLTT